MSHKKKDLITLVLGIVGLALLVTVLDHFQDEMAGAFHPASDTLTTPELEEGKRLTRTCQACHDMTPARRLNKVGPPLWGTVGSRAGQVEHYNYSEAHTTRAKACLIWDQETLDHYLRNPKAFIPGNRMAYAGMRNAKDRQMLIEYLSTLKDDTSSPSTPLSYLKQLGKTTELLTGFGSGQDSSDADAIDQNWTRKLQNLDAKTLDYGHQLTGYCSDCHDLSIRQTQNKGPYLWRIVDRKAGTSRQFCHSEGFLAKINKTGIVWTPTQLDSFLTAPQRFFPDTQIPCPKFPDPQDRLALIGSLNRLQ